MNSRTNEARLCEYEMYSNVHLCVCMCVSTLTSLYLLALHIYILYGNEWMSVCDECCSLWSPLYLCSLWFPLYQHNVKHCVPCLTQITLVCVYLRTIYSSFSICTLQSVFPSALARPETTQTNPNRPDPRRPFDFNPFTAWVHLRQLLGTSLCRSLR